MSILMLKAFITKQQAMRGSSVGGVSAWYAYGRGFDPLVRQHSFVEIGHEMISPFRWFKKGSCQNVF